MKSNPLGFKTGAVALPEFGTPFVQGLLEEAHPKDFNDLLIISGLSHGTDVWNSNAEDLVVKQGKTLQEVVGCRDDIMNYLIDEGVDASLAFQFMETVRKNKDRCNAKKIEKMIPELAAKGVPDWYLDSCRKIQYLFPRAHAVAYVIGAVRAGWFKIYHPLAFYATYFTTRCDKYDIQLMNGDFNALVERTKWLNEHKSELQEMWQTQKIVKLPPLKD
jgi:DNA polymerase-3 subunit alpha (Gram-positive type)